MAADLASTTVAGATFATGAQRAGRGRQGDDDLHLTTCARGRGLSVARARVTSALVRSSAIAAGASAAGRPVGSLCFSATGLSALGCTVPRRVIYFVYVRP